MSAGDSEVPPTYYFSGITFNPDFYQSSSGNYLTYETAKSSFLTYPTAQGEETISTLNSSSIDTTTLTSTTSITTPALNSTSASTALTIGSNVETADITIAGGQTSRTLNIGTGARSGNNSTINIGTVAGGATKVNIGTAAKTTISLLGLSVDVGTKITSPAYGSSADDGNLTLGANITTGNLKIGGAQTDGDIEIGCGNDRLVDGAIRIGNGNTNAAFPITIGATNSKTDMNGSCTFAKQISASLGITSAGAITTTSGAITSASTVSGTTITASTGLVGAYQNKASSASASITTTGVITGASLGLGTGAIGCGAITSGAISGTTMTASGLISANGGMTVPSGQTLTVNGTLKSSSLDAVSDATAGNTALTIGSNVVLGNIEIGGALTAGDITIGKNNSTGAIITIGTESTSTTIKGGINFQLISENNSVLTTTTRIVNGKIGQIISPISTSPYTINADTINDRLVFVIQNPASGTINLPSTINLGQTITFRNTSSNAVTISANGKNLVVPNSNATVGSAVLASLGAVTYYGYASTIWLSIS